MLLVHIDTMRQFQCAHTCTTYVYSINGGFSPYINFSTTFFMFQCNEHVELNKL